MSAITNAKGGILERVKTGRRGVCHADDRSFRSRAAAVSDSKRSLAGVAGPAVLWGLLGLSGLVYEIIVARRMQRQIVYTPEFEDWLFHVLLPLAAYATLAGSACAALGHAHEAMFGVAAAALLLLFIGIHNAWDAITYHVFVKRGREANERPR